MGKSNSKQEWLDKTRKPFIEKRAEQKDKFTTLSNVNVEPLYSKSDLKKDDKENIGYPGEYPYTRGVYPSMYRGRYWTMRQYAGFGDAKQSNERYKYLLSQGQTGLSVAFDLPTQIGYDSSDQICDGEVGKVGVAIDSLKDMEILFDGIPLDKVSTSMTINSPAAVLLAMYIVVAEKQGVTMDKLTGTIQNDILKEYVARGTYIFPPKPSMRLITDIFEYCSKNVPRWKTISISGYHIREAGSTAIQELAFTLGDGLAYVDAAMERGLELDDFAPRLSFFFNAHNDLFEEIAKYRAARRIWAHEMKKRGAKKDRSMWLRFHTQTAGCSLTAQQPENNIVRTTIQAMAAVMGGTQSLHTNSMDEALALPSEKAVKIALRTQRIIGHESGITNTIDPLAGSYFVEYMTDFMEEETYKYFDKVESLGGVLKAIEKGFFQQEIANASFKYQNEIETNKRIMVGVNDFTEDEEIDIPLLKMDPEGERKQLERLNKLRSDRDPARYTQALEKLGKAAEGQENMMPYILEAVKAKATLGETCNVLREIFGEYDEPPIY